MPSTGIAALPDNLRSQFLEGLVPGQRKTILAAATQRRFAARSAITNQGQSAEYLFLLTKGLARFFFVTDEGRKLLFRWIGPGDLFGGRAVLSSPSSYLLGTETVTDSTALVWNRQTIRGLLSQYPQLVENAFLTASDYLAWQLTAHVSLACRTARQRIAQVLITLVRTVGQKVDGGIALQITNEDLANAANVTAFTASRLMSEWQRERAIVKRRGEVLVRSEERLLLHVM